jgi:hypothetical protein
MMAIAQTSTSPITALEDDDLEIFRCIKHLWATLAPFRKRQTLDGVA